MNRKISTVGFVLLVFTVIQFSLVARPRLYSLRDISGHNVHLDDSVLRREESAPFPLHSRNSSPSQVPRHAPSLSLVVAATDSPLPADLSDEVILLSVGRLLPLSGDDIASASDARMATRSFSFLADHRAVLSTATPDLLAHLFILRKVNSPRRAVGTAFDSQGADRYRSSKPRERRTFTKSSPSSFYALQSVAHGTYLSCEPLSGLLVTDRMRPGAYEAFAFERVAEGFPHVHNSTISSAPMHASSRLLQLSTSEGDSFEPRSAQYVMRCGYSGGVVYSAACPTPLAPSDVGSSSTAHRQTTRTNGIRCLQSSGSVLTAEVQAISTVVSVLGIRYRPEKNGNSSAVLLFSEVLKSLSRTGRPSAGGGARQGPEADRKQSVAPADHVVARAAEFHASWRTLLTAISNKVSVSSEYFKEGESSAGISATTSLVKTLKQNYALLPFLVQDFVLQTTLASSVLPDIRLHVVASARPEALRDLAEYSVKGVARLNSSAAVVLAVESLRSFHVSVAGDTDGFESVGEAETPSFPSRPTYRGLIQFAWNSARGRSCAPNQTHEALPKDAYCVQPSYRHEGSERSSFCTMPDVGAHETKAATLQNSLISVPAFINSDIILPSSSAVRSTVACVAAVTALLGVPALLTGLRQNVPSSVWRNIFLQKQQSSSRLDMCTALQSAAEAFDPNGQDFFFFVPGSSPLQSESCAASMTSCRSSQCSFLAGHNDLAHFSCIIECLRRSFVACRLNADIEKLDAILSGLPPFVVGGVAFDNWLTSAAASMRSFMPASSSIVGVDVTESISAWHLSHGWAWASRKSVASDFNTKLARSNGGWNCGSTLCLPLYSTFIKHNGSSSVVLSVRKPRLWPLSRGAITRA